MTNAHVADHADKITVRLTDKREFSARLIGAVARIDVALFKIEAKGLPTVKVGDQQAQGGRMGGGDRFAIRL
jgi:serine protease Do